MSRSVAVGDKVTGLQLSQEQAAQAADIASSTVWVETSGIAELPDGKMVVLPLRIDQGVALMVNPDGSATKFTGALYQFLEYLG